MRRFALIIPLFLILIPLTLVHSSAEVYPENMVPATGRIQDVDLVLDGVELTLSTPFLPSQHIIVPDPGDPFQVANIVQKEPSFRSLSLTAIPFGTRPSVEIFPFAEPDNIETYQVALRNYRRLQGGKPVSGPIATIFGQEVTGIASTVYLNIDVFEPKPVRIVEWVVEAGNRIWLLRICQEMQEMAYYLHDQGGRQTGGDLTGIKLSGTHLESPSPGVGSLDVLSTSIASLSSDTDLPFPSWWNGDCDYNTYHTQTGDPSYPLGGSYRGVKACGPRPYFDSAANAYTRFNPGWWGVLEWECVELSMRFLYLAYGVQTYQANGNQVVTNYSGDQLIKINDGVPGFAPQPNDVLSLGPETPVGHTSVVTASNVDLQGNGTITVLEQNASSTGERTYTVSNWAIQSSFTVIGWLHDPGDGDHTPPIGDILEPLGNQTILTSTIHLEGWASDDDSGLNSAQFIANYAGSWHDIGPFFADILFSYDWDWCEDDVPDGPISLALRLTDNQGNTASGMPGLRHAVKNFTCPSIPKCTPTADQVALFADPDFSGDCQILNIGNYLDNSSFNIVGNDELESLIVGGNVMATMYTKTGYQGRRETITGNDANLSENRTGSNSLTSLKVIDLETLPAVPSHQWPPNLSAYSESDSLTLFWNDEGGDSLMRASIDGPSLTQTSSWGSATTWSLGSLSPGVYSWRLQARNGYGDSDWSSWYFFTISEDSTSFPASTTPPYSDTVEGDTSAWASSNLWHPTDNDSHSSNNSWWYSHSVTQTYDTNGVNFGTLTTPPIALPTVSLPYHLEFWSKYETEASFEHWDQRRVQISIDGGNFQDIFQLKDDPSREWLKVKLDLSPYYTLGVSHDLQVRFYFNSVDEVQNDFLGWYIDDIGVSASSPLVCSDLHEDNDIPQDASGIAYGDTLNAEICPGTDRDFYSFTGLAGDQIVVDIDAKSTGSELDSLIQILDQDGTSILATHDDEIPGIRQDPHLGYRLPRDGIYTLKVQAWDTPMGTGSYTLTLFTDDIVPTLDSVNPSSGAFLPAAEIYFQAIADDSLSGVSRVQLLGYVDGWDLVGEDWDGSDGWENSFDTSGLTEGDQIDFYTRAYDWAGNWTGIAAWDLTLDFTYPDTTADPLPNPSESTAIHLNWSATDNLAGIRSYGVRHRINSGTWGNQSFDRDTSEWWYIGNAGNSYTFRIRAIDEAGNLEPYLEGAEVSTTIPAIATLCSTPDPWDASASVNDNSSTSATPLPTSSQSHNFCNPATTDRLHDVDWFHLDAESDHIYTISGIPTHESAGVVIKLYDSDGSSLLGESSPGKFGEPSTLIWSSDQEKTVYIALSHLDGRVAGNGVAYTVSYEASLTGTVIYFPLIYK